MRSSGLPAIFAVRRWYICGVTGMESATSWVLRSGLGWCPVVSAAGVAAVAFGLDALDGEAGEAERVAELGGGVFEVDDALGVGGFVDAVDAGDGVGLRSSGRRTRWRRA